MIIIPIFKVIVPIVLIVLGLFNTIAYFQIRKRFYSWPVVAARIIESELRNHTNADGNRVYEANIEYEYEFRGHIYHSNTPILKGYELFIQWDREDALIKKYRNGDIVNARVCPSAPRICYLEIANLDWLSTALVPIGILLSGLWIYFVFFVLEI